MSVVCGSRCILFRGRPESSNGPAGPGRKQRRSSGPRRWLAAAFSVAALCGQPLRPAVAAETDLYVALHYGVDPSVRGCSDEAEFRQSVANRIGYDPFREDASVEVRVRVGGATNAVDGHVEWRRASGLLMGERRFVAKDGNCAKLLTEMSFAVGLQIELLRPKAPAGTGPVSSARGGAATSSPSPGAAAAATPPPSAPAPASAPLAAPSRPLPPAATPPPVSAPPPPKPDVPDEPPDRSRRARRLPPPPPLRRLGRCGSGSGRPWPGGFRPASPQMDASSSESAATISRWKSVRRRPTRQPNVVGTTAAFARL